MTTQCYQQSKQLPSRTLWHVFFVPIGFTYVLSHLFNGNDKEDVDVAGLRATEDNLD